MCLASQILVSLNGEFSGTVQFEMVIILVYQKEGSSSACVKDETLLTEVFKAAVSKAAVSLLSFPRCSCGLLEVQFVSVGDWKQNYRPFASVQMWPRVQQAGQESGDLPREAG